jgi:hypothetical protein
MPLDRKDALLVFGTALQSAQVYSAFNPSIFTIRQFADGRGTINDIRRGEILASGFAIGLGALMAGIIDSSLPFWVSVGVSFFMVYVYEWALHNPRKGVMQNASDEEA